MGGVINSITGGKNKYKADEGAYDPMIAGSGDNNLALQKSLMEQMNGGGPNLGQQQFQNATQQLQQQAAGQIGSIKGISPAAQARLIQQQQATVGQNLAGESALQRMQQQMLAQQQLGQNSMGMYDVSTGRKQGAQQINAGVAQNNADNAQKTTGGLLGGAGSALAFLADGGEVPAADGPQSELGRALMGLAKGGPVFMADGGVPGRAPVAGDSPRNDVVPAALSPGEIVIPRSHAGSPDAAASFVEALQRRGGGGYEGVASARAMCSGGKAYADGGEIEDEDGPYSTPPQDSMGLMVAQKAGKVASGFAAGMKPTEGGSSPPIRVDGGRILRSAYAEGGEVEEPSLSQRAARWWETSSDAARESLVGAVADALPNALGGKVRKQAGERKAKIDAAGRE